jgi:propanol-preferring alcohol dehydrogenase
VKAAVLHRVGQPFSLEDAPLPTLAADQILLRVEACGVCHSDLHVARGDWPTVTKLLELPAILGHEVVGVVDAKGESVSALDEGQRVGVGWLHWACGECEFCRQEAEHLCAERLVTGVRVPGGYAAFMAAKASHAMPIPEGLRSGEAAPLLCAGVTVVRACRRAEVQPGQRVAVFGVGGLGHLAIQVARHRGAEVTAVDVAAEKLDLASSLGATHGLLAKEAPKAIKARGGAHVALVPVGSRAAYDAAFRSLRAGGALVVIGIPTEDLALSADFMTTKEFRVMGSGVGTRDDVRETLRLAAAGHLRCQVQTRSLDEINQVFDELEQGRIQGRAVVVF